MTEEMNKQKTALTWTGLSLVFCAIWGITGIILLIITGLDTVMTEFMAFFSNAPMGVRIGIIFITPSILGLFIPFGSWFVLMNDLTYKYYEGETN